jgi:hypothetical protein
MNLARIAKSLFLETKLAAYRIPPDEVIATRSGYYSNAGLDMAQYDETRSAAVTIYTEDGMNVKGYAVANIYGAQAPGAGIENEENKDFGPIDRVNVGAIERWAENWLEFYKVKAKIGWSGFTNSNRRSSLKKLIMLKLEKVTQPL